MSFHGHVLRREDDHLLRMGLYIVVKGQRKQEAEEDMKEAG